MRGAAFEASTADVASDARRHEGTPVRLDLEWVRGYPQQSECQARGDVLAPFRGMDDPRRHIGDGIRSGNLPDGDCLVTRFGTGRGEVCAVCASRILGSEVSVECEVPQRSTVWFHARCYTEWLSVRHA